MSLLAAAALQLAPSLISAGVKRFQDKKLLGEQEKFFGDIKREAAAEMEASKAAREAAKQDIKVGETYRKYLDTALQDPASDFLRKEAMRSQAEQIGALKQGGARALLGGLGRTAASTARTMEDIAVGEQERKLSALSTYADIEQKQRDKRIAEILRDARGDLSLSRDQYASSMLGEKQAELENLLSKQEFTGGLISSGFDTLGFLADEGAFGDFFKAKNGIKLPGKFDHGSNPIDLVRSGKKIGEATGNEYIVTPEQAKKISKESAFARKLFKKFENRAKS